MLSFLNIQKGNFNPYFVVVVIIKVPGRVFSASVVSFSISGSSKQVAFANTMFASAQSITVKSPWMNWKSIFVLFSFFKDLIYSKSSLSS